MNHSSLNLDTISCKKIMQFQKALISRGTFCKNLTCNHESTSLFGSADNCDALLIWYHLHNLKNVKNTHGVVSLNKPARLLKITLLHGVIHVLKIVRMVLNRAKHHHRRYEKSKLRKHNNAMSLYFSLDQVRVLPSSLTLHTQK